MRMISVTIGHAMVGGAVSWVNAKGVTRFVHSFHQEAAGTTVVLLFDTYRDYCWACDKMDVEPMSISDFVG